MSLDEEGIFTGTLKPPNIPPNWSGEPLPDDKGWRWFNPDNRGDSVRIYRPDQAAPEVERRVANVVVTVDGQMIDGNGEPTGHWLED